MKDEQLLAFLREVLLKYGHELTGPGVPRRVLERLDSDILSVVRPWLIARAKEIK